MPEPKPVGRLHPVFLDRVGELRDQAAAIADPPGEEEADHGYRDWQIPGGSAAPLDIVGMIPAFDRSAINANYRQALGEEDAGATIGTAGDAIALKRQIDYVACLERAYRARHASAIRCRRHAQGRRAGHGHVQGVFGAVIRQTQDAIASGSR